MKPHKVSIIVANDRRLINIDTRPVSGAAAAARAHRSRAATRIARVICVDSAIRANANEHANLGSRILVNFKL